MTAPADDAVPGPVAAPGPGTMLALGAHLGAEVWWCDQVFSLAGAWVPTTAEVTVRAHLADVSRVVGEHALALRHHLPRPAPVDPEAWVRPPSEGAARLVTDLGSTAGPAPRLAVLHRLLATWLLSAWDRPRGASATASTRAIRHARTDLGDLRREGEALLEAVVIEDPTTVRAVHAAVADGEVALVAAGGLHPPAPHRIPSDR